MGALSVIEPAGLPADFATWLETCRSLLSERGRIDWKLAEHIKRGRETFGEQAGFDFLSDELGLDVKRMKRWEQLIDRHPSGQRDMTIPFEAYEAAISLPVPDALGLIRDAKKNRWDDREIRVEAVKRRAEMQPSLGREIDWPYHFLMELQRAWNRTDAETRQDFYDAITEANMGDVDL